MAGGASRSRETRRGSVLVLDMALRGVDLLTSNQMLYPCTPGVSGNRTLPTALPVRPPGTSWDNALLKRHSNAFQAMSRNPLTPQPLTSTTLLDAPLPCALEQR